MNVLVLGVTPSPITPILRENGCVVTEYENSINVDFLKERAIEFAVSYRYRYIVTNAVIYYLRGKIINLHISLLPWNRGADPNLWSFLEDTPKGVTIHYVDDGLDTGDIIAQKESVFDSPEETLASTYKKLNSEIIELFRENWPLIATGNAPRMKQASGGSFHRIKDKDEFKHVLAEKGWDTPVEELSGLAVIQSGK